MSEDVQMDFMRKSRFKTIANQFKEISPEAQKIIDSAKDSDILKITMSFNTPTLKVDVVEIFDEDKFVQLAF